MVILKKTNKWIGSAIVHLYVASKPLSVINAQCNQCRPRIVAAENHVMKSESR